MTDDPKELANKVAHLLGARGLAASQLDVDLITENLLPYIQQRVDAAVTNAIAGHRERIDHLTKSLNLEIGKRKAAEVHQEMMDADRGRCAHVAAAIRSGETKKG